MQHGAIRQQQYEPSPIQVAKEILQRAQTRDRLMLDQEELLQQQHRPSSGSSHRLGVGSGGGGSSRAATRAEINDNNNFPTTLSFTQPRLSASSAVSSSFQHDSSSKTSTTRHFYKTAALCPDHHHHHILNKSDGFNQAFDNNNNNMTNDAVRRRHEQKSKHHNNRGSGVSGSTFVDSEFNQVAEEGYGVHDEQLERASHDDDDDDDEDSDNNVDDDGDVAELDNVLYEYINPAMNILDAPAPTSADMIKGSSSNNNNNVRGVSLDTSGGGGSVEQHHYYHTIVVNGELIDRVGGSVGGGPEGDDSSRSYTGMASPAYLHDQAAHFRNYIWSFFQPAVDNKLALKLFGSASAIVREQERQNANNKWIVHPASNFRFYWDLMMLLLLLINLIVLPVSISFFYNETLSMRWIIFNCVSDTIFMVDIGVNFRTGIMHPDNAAQVILEPKVLAKRYLKTWFFVDLLSSIPFDYFVFITTVWGNNVELHAQVAQAGRAFRMLRLAKILSLMKLLRLSRLLRYVSQFEAVYFINLAGVFMRIFNFLALMLLLGHWSGCIQFMIPVLQGFPRDSWVVINELVDAPWFDQYTWALWQALSHMLCIGYGRFPPQNITDCWLTICSMLTGAMSYALFIGHASNLIQSLDASRRNCREKWKQVEEYMAYRKLPRPLRIKIADYYDHRYQGKLFNEVTILEELSDPLKEAIINFNCRDLVKSVPFFTHADPNFVTAVIIKLNYEFFQPNDVIVKESMIGDKMYFIQEGVVEIYMGNKDVGETIITCLSDGSYFGEICLLTKAKRVASVRAQTYCSLFSLHSDNFNVVLEQYPLMRRTLESVAAERLNKIGKDPNMVSQRPDLPDDLKRVNELLEQVATLSREPSAINIHAKPTDDNAIETLGAGSSDEHHHKNSPGSHSHHTLFSAFTSGFTSAAKRRKKSLAIANTALTTRADRKKSTSDTAGEETASLASSGEGNHNSNSPTSATHFRLRLLRAKLRSLSRTFSPGNSRRASRADPERSGSWNPR